MTRRIPLIGTVVLAVVVLVAAVYVITHNRAPAPTAAAPATGARSSIEATAISRPAPTATARATATSDSTGAPTTAAATGVPRSGGLIAFVGDDYTASVGAGARSAGFVARVGAALGVRTATFAAPGGGFAKHGDGDRTYGSLVADVVAAAPAVVVVSGGRNDVSDYLPTMQQAATSLFAALAKGLPGATIVAVAPWWGDSAHPPELDAVAAAVRTAVTGAGGRYLDIADPLVGHPEWMADGSDPNAAGYAAIATSLTPRLRALATG